MLLMNDASFDIPYVEVRSAIVHIYYCFVWQALSLHICLFIEIIAQSILLTTMQHIMIHYKLRRKHQEPSIMKYWIFAGIQRFAFWQQGALRCHIRGCWTFRPQDVSTPKNQDVSTPKTFQPQDVSTPSGFC